MKKQRHSWITLVCAAFAGLTVLSLTACSDGRAENAGEDIDNAIEEAEDTVDDAVDDAGDAIDDAADAVDDAVEEIDGTS